MITNEDGGYPNGIGHSGSETSEAAQVKITGNRAIEVHEAVKVRGRRGMTCRNLQKTLLIGHGAASGALTRLHRAGHLVRLQESRDGQQVYVTQEWAMGREESPYRPNIAYRDGYKKPMALEEILSDEQIEKMVLFCRENGASNPTLLTLERWLPRIRNGMSE